MLFVDYKSFIEKKELLQSNISKKRVDKIKLQTDQEFKQRNMEKLNKKLDLEMQSTHVRGGKAFAAKQKIKELKKLLFRSKRIQKFEGKFQEVYDLHG